MKRFLAIAIMMLSACGSASSTPPFFPPPEPPPATAGEPPADDQAEGMAQPFNFEPVGSYLSGAPVDLIALPNGFWIVATINGQVYLLNTDMKIARHFSFPVQTYADSGLMSAVLDEQGRVYFYFTAFSDLPECQDVFCNFVVRYEIDQQAEDFLHSPETIAVFPMVNKGGVHNGGGMAFGPDGMLYVAVGEGELTDEMTYDYAQDPASPLGKVHRIDPGTLDGVQVASGLRNPFTMAPTPGGALIGDVGFDAWEEVNLLSWLGGDNFGWPLTEGPFSAAQWPDFTPPIHAFRHCDDSLKDEDPHGHTEQGKAMAIKNHGGIVHACSSEIVAVAGYYPPRQEGFPDPYDGALDGAAIYSEPYYGWVRAFDLEDPSTDRHIGHMPGLVAVAEGLDGHLYGVSIFASPHVLRLTRAE